jgi:RNA polymerase sigma-70 factor, ECF subfamily
MRCPGRALRPNPMTGSMSQDRHDDRTLVDATLAGDANAFRALVERDVRVVIAVCARILRDPTEGEDVAQEAFLRAYQKLATFRGDGSFRAWVTRIAVREAANRLAVRHVTWSLDDEEHRGVSFETLPSEVDLELGALDHESRDALWAAVAELPAAQRDAVALRFGRDLSIEEIAALTDAPVGTVKSRLHRAFATLRDHLGSRPTE